MSRHIIVIIHDWERMLNRHPRFLEIHCRRGGRSRGRTSHLTRSLAASEGWSRRWSGIVQTENSARHTKYGRIRGMIVGEGGRSTGVLLYFDVQIHVYSFNDVFSVNQ